MQKSIAMIFSFALAGTMLHAQQNNPKDPPPPPPPKMEVVKVKPPVIITEELEDFYSRNPEVDKIKWHSAEKVIITFKDKTRKNEVFNLANEDDQKTFKEKYGEAPIQPPPPPPTPPGKKAFQ